MPCFDPTEFGRFIARLTPHELRQAEGMVAEAGEWALAVMEVDARAEAGGPAASCPRCQGGARSVGPDADRRAAMVLLGL